MGNQESTKTPSLSYDQAVKRLTSEEQKRLKAAFKKIGTDSMDYMTFRRQVCTELIPQETCRTLFDAFCSGNRLKLEELVIGLTLLAKGSMLERKDFFGQLDDCSVPSEWIIKPPRLTDDSCQKASSFYEILAGVTHLTEDEVCELEKVWVSLADPRLCKLTPELFRTLVSPPVPQELVKGFFSAFDENNDSLIDFKELVCGLSASCRGPKTEKLKFVFKMCNDQDNGYLSESQIESMCHKFTQENQVNWIKERGISRQLSMHEFLTWAMETGAADGVLQMLEEVGHICLGLKPLSFTDEKIIVRSWRNRFDLVGLNQCSRWMIISLIWWEKWEKAEAFDLVPAIDNSPLVVKEKSDVLYKLSSLTNEGGILRKDLRSDEFLTVSDCLWSAMSRWHNGGQPALPRYLITDPNTEQLMIELYPVTIIVLRHQQVTGPNYSSLSGVASSTMEWIKDTVISSLSGATPNYKRVPQFTVTFSKVARVSELFTFLCQRQRLNPESARLWLMITPADSKEKSTAMMLLEEESLTLAELQIQSGATMLLEVRSSDLTWPEEVIQLRAKGYFKLDLKLQACEKGVTGLNNLGNTCFMNSALQCTSNTKALTDYFTDNKHIQEINRTNLMGSKGQIALEYGTLIKDLWSGSSRVVAPLKFRSTINKHVSTFRDLYQHDCQEFLAFLLDGLHEDLNRVQSQQKYDELKDSDGRPDAEVADEAWQHHSKRNRSVVTDLFHGQLKSEVTCRECGCKSARFDPFTFLSLPLPIEEYTLLQVVVTKLDGSLPVRYGFRLKCDEIVADLIAHVSQKCHIPPERLLLLELNKLGIFYREPSVNEKVKLIGRETLLYAYELPEPSICHVPNGIVVSDKRPPTHGQFIIACHRKLERSNVYFLAHSRSKYVGFGLPVVVPFATDITGNVLYQRVLDLLQRLVHPPGGVNRAHDAEEDIGYPFTLCVVQGLTGTEQQCCSNCQWSNLCHGCPIEQNDKKIDYDLANCYLTIDWDSTALHLRYQYSSELLCVDDGSIGETLADHYRPSSIDSCLHEFTSVEELDDDEAVYCKQCKENRHVSKKLDIWRLPQILIVHLKRFVFTNNRWVKSSKIVQFPLTKFDPSVYMASELEEHAVYDCFAIANHYGDMGAGHYVAYCKNPFSEKWWLYNDSRCKEIVESEIDRNNSYLLFYERRANEQTKL